MYRFASVVVIHLSLIFYASVALVRSQDGSADFSTIYESSRALGHLLPLFTIHGVPKNGLADDLLTILINHGYVVGFSPKHNQPRFGRTKMQKNIQCAERAKY